MRELRKLTQELLPLLGAYDLSPTDSSTTERLDDISERADAVCQRIDGYQATGLGGLPPNAVGQGVLQIATKEVTMNEETLIRERAWELKDEPGARLWGDFFRTVWWPRVAPHETFLAHQILAEIAYRDVNEAPLCADYVRSCAWPMYDNAGTDDATVEKQAFLDKVAERVEHFGQVPALRKRPFAERRQAWKTVMSQPPVGDNWHVTVSCLLLAEGAVNEQRAVQWALEKWARCESPCERWVYDEVLVGLWKKDAAAALTSIQEFQTIGPFLFSPNVMLWMLGQALSKAVGSPLYHDCSVRLMDLMRRESPGYVHYSLVRFVDALERSNQPFDEALLQEGVATLAAYKPFPGVAEDYRHLQRVITSLVGKGA
jgi:hypothetical protein